MVVRRHRDNVFQVETVVMRRGRNVVDIAQSPPLMLLAQHGIEVPVAPGAKLAIEREEAVNEEMGARREQTPGAGSEPLHRGAFRAVEHVDAKDEPELPVKPFPPRLVENIERKGRPDIGQRSRPGGFACPHTFVRIAGLPVGVRKGGGETGDMLTRAAGDFQHPGAVAAVAIEDAENGPAVAIRRRCMEPVIPVGCTVRPG